MKDIIIYNLKKLKVVLNCGNIFSKLRKEEYLCIQLQELTTLRNIIEARHTYYVQLDYDPQTSLVNKIIIKYEESDSITR